jgi:1A family penicillin-binding protein
MQLRSFLKIVALLFVVCLIAIVSFTYAYYSPYVSSKEKLLNYKDRGIVLTDRNDVPFYFINNAKSDKYVPLNDISPYMPKAIIAAEDTNFYHHHGISIRGIIRSVLLNFQTGGFSYGGSTLTQQLVKNALLTPKKSLLRKFQEALLAVDIEGKYTKNQIIEMYMNTIYYGDGAVGIEEASHVYFNREPKDLTLAQAAYLAGMLKFPTLLSPYTGDVTRGERIQREVLDKMVNDGLVSQKEVDKAEGEELTFTKSPDIAENVAPHFSIMVEQKLKQMYGDDVVYDGLKVKTSLDLSMQKYVQEVVKTNVNENLANGVSNGAVVVLDPTNGEILVLVGSKDWYNEKYGRVNMAISPRQPGSSFKPIVYSLAMDEGLIAPASILEDKPTTYVLDPNCQSGPNCKYTPHDYDNRYRGKVTVRRALANSLNIPAVEVMNEVGIDALLARAPDFGITTLKDASYYGRGLSLVLGSAEVSPLEMADAYATFANQGQRPDPVMILEVKDKFGSIKYQYSPELRTVISPQSAYLISSILSDNKARQEEFGNILTTPFPAAVKTGTTENYRDAWTIGYTPHLVTAVWVGNNDATPIHNLSGSLAAGPIWKEVMEEFVPKSFDGFSMPDGIVEAKYCDTSSSGSARMDYFIAGTQPLSDCIHFPQGRNGRMASNNSRERSSFESDLDNFPDDNDNNTTPTPTPIPITPTPTLTPTPTPTAQ